MNDSAQVSVDVVIPTYRPDGRLDRLLTRLSKQSVTPGRIIIMNTEKDLFRCQCARDIPNLEIHHISKASFDHGGTRNQGASFSKAEFLLFMTQDAVPADRHLIENLLKPFDDSQVAVVYARQMADPKKNYLDYYTRLFNYPEQSRKKTAADEKELGIKTYFCSNVCAMYKRSDYDGAGGFPVHALFNEDMMMAQKLIGSGKAVCYQADARVWHSHNYSALQQLKRNFDVAASQQMAGGALSRVRSESEGIKLVKRTCRDMIRHGHPLILIRAIWQDGFKYIGYRLGKKYDRLPVSLVKKISLNPGFWDTRG